MTTMPAIRPHGRPAPVTCAAPRRADRRRAALLSAAAALLVACGRGRGGPEAGPSPAVVTPPGAGGGRADEGPPWFVESARSAGIDFTYLSGHRERFLMPEIMGGGAALFDMDNDGDLDAFLVQAGGVEADPASRPPSRLYRNRGDGTFEDVTDGSGAGARGYGNGVAAGDYDNDGLTDLYVTNLGPNTLLRNAGGGKFAVVPDAGGAAGDDWSSSAAFVDFDRDGDLDLFVTNYLEWRPQTERPCTIESGAADYCSPLAYAAPAQDRLYRNEGDGTFTDATAAAATAWASCPATSTATAGRTSSWPTTARRTSSGSTAGTGRSPIRRRCSAWPSTRTARPRPAWAPPPPTSTTTATSTSWSST